MERRRVGKEEGDKDGRERDKTYRTDQDELGRKKGQDQHQLVITETLALEFVRMSFIQA